jgi:hypothetical protein
MKLVIHNPKNDIDQTFDSCLLSENDSIDFLKSEGWKFAMEEGTENTG